MSKKFFTAIKKGDFSTVRQMLEKKPTLVFAAAKAPPKSDDGQSPLQIAIRNQEFDIAHYLLDRGADVNFMESEDCCNQWRMPVLQDAIRAAVFSARWNNFDLDGNMRVYRTEADADAAFSVLERLVAMGADIHCRDSYGNSCLSRAILDARQILPAYHRATKTVGTDRVLTDELRADLSRIFRLLFAAGADRTERDRYTDRLLTDVDDENPLAEFLRL